MPDPTSPWWLSWRADPRAKALADRHYNRQNPDSAQFVPPGRCLVLWAPAPAFWVTSWPQAEFVKHDWPGAWVNSAFRREGGDLQSSAMIHAAVAHTRWKWPDVPDLGMVTMVDPRHVKHAGRNREPGWVYKQAGFRHVGFTKEDHLWVWQLLPKDMPEPMMPLGAPTELDFGESA